MILHICEPTSDFFFNHTIKEKDEMTHLGVTNGFFIHIGEKKWSINKKTHNPNHKRKIPKP
jgi:hypothetical protein